MKVNGLFNHSLIERHLWGVMSELLCTSGYRFLWEHVFVSPE